MRAGRRLAGALPAPIARGMASSGALALSRLPGPEWAARRAMVARHLARVLGPDAPAANSRAMHHLVDETFASYARYWAESLRVPDLGETRLSAGIHYDGYEHLAAARAAGRGAILVLPHLGGWEWAGAQLAATGHQVSVVVERLEPDDLFEWFVSFREALGMHVIPAGPGAGAACRAALAANHVLGLLSDRTLEATSGVEVEFFAERTVLPAGPATLALRSGATLLPCAVYFEDRTDAHHGVIRPPLDTSRPTRRDGPGWLRAEIARITQAMAGELEELIRAAPTQWHLMQPNWPSDRPATGPRVP